MSLWKRGSTANGAYEKTLSLFGEGSQTKGEFGTPGNLRIEGTFQGRLQVGGRLVIAESAEVSGTIRSHQVHIAGKFSGEIFAEDNIEIASTAEVRGQLRARRLECEKGAMLEVRCWIGEETSSPPVQEMVGADATSKNNRNH